MKILLQISIITGFLVFLILGINTAWSDDDEHEYHQRAVGVANVTSQIYTEECGSCHMAYSPGLLPSKSWRAIMTGLSDHFGDNAELTQEVLLEIDKFLQDNSADKSDYRRSKSMLRSLEKLADIPIRITRMPYFIKEHNEIPNSMVKANAKVVSFSNCDACHRRATQGLFSENEIDIPGFGTWDD